MFNRIGHYYVVAALVAVASLHPAIETRAQGTSTAQVLKSCYQLSKVAATYEQYSQIIDEISTVNLQAADDSARAYANQLASWAMNRRGEWLWDRMQQPDDANAMAAIDDFVSSLQLDPRRWRAKQNMAFVYATRGQMAEAEKLLNEVVQAKPDHANAYFNRAELRYEMGNLVAANEDYDMAIRLAPNEADYYASRGHTLFRLGHLERAVSDYRAAFERDSNNAARAIDLADAMQNAGHWQEAAGAYELANELEIGNFRSQLNLAWLLATTPDESIRDGQQAIQIISQLREVPEDEEFRYIDTYAAALAETSQFEKAVRIANSGMKLAPNTEKQAFEARLVKYKSNQPFRQASRKTQPVANQESFPSN